MKAQVVRGSKERIAEAIIRIAGEVREAVVFVGEPAALTEGLSEEHVFAEMEPFMVKVGGVDYSREALYTRKEKE